MFSCTCLIFVDSNTKRFLSVLGVFGKYFVFTKTENFKNSVALFWRLSLGHSSHIPQLRARGSVLTTCWWVEGPVTRGTKRFSRLSSRLPREWDFQLRKTLSKFFQNFWLEVFWRDWWFVSVVKIACLAFQRQFLKPFQLSLELFMSIHFLSQLKLTQTLRVTLYKLYCCFISSQIFKKKVWVFSSSLHISCFEYYFLDFCVVTVIWNILCLNMFLLKLLGMGWLFLLLISFCYHNLFSLC